MTDHALLVTIIVLWLVIAVAFVAWRWAVGRGVGLVVSMVLGLSGIHWLAATLYLLPWHDGFDPAAVVTGLRTAFEGFCALCVGAFIASRKPKDDIAATAANASIAPFGWTYLVIGLLMYAVLWPRFGRVASLGALVAAGAQYIVAGICLRCWRADPGRLAKWMAVAALLPFLTILMQGYLSYGLAALATVAAFVGEELRSRKTLLVVGVVVGYLTMSFYVTYMRDRAEIRRAVWAGADASQRLDVITNSFADFEWFDATNPEHLWRIDERLNQDYFVGLAVERLRSRLVSYAMGETVQDAMTALLPRILYPEKGVEAGSADIVSRFTGVSFMEGTSVGVGVILEMFVNFGRAGVWIGLFLLGAVLVIIDERAHHHLGRGSATGFAMWYLPGTSLLQLSGGSVVDASLTAAATVASVFIVNIAVTRLSRRAGTSAVWPAPAASSRSAV